MMECINEINVDNDIINNLEEYTQDEFENEWYNRDNIYILYEDDSKIIFFN
jgi:hypothetical protein